MYLSLFVIIVLLSAAFATTPILVSECGTLERSFRTYQLVQDVVVRNSSYGYVCFDIKGDGIMLDGNGFQLSPASNKMLRAIGVQNSGARNTIRNLRISNLRTGVHTKGKFGEIFNNTITHAINGIDVSATNNRILNNTIGHFEAHESAAGIYVYFPAIAPVDSFINITNNVISDIRGDFALGISVYYATSVFVSHNYIFNLQGGISSEEISVIHGKIESFSNSFSAPPPPDGSYTKVITILASIFSLVASLVFFHASSLSVSPPSSTSTRENEEKSEGEREKEKEMEEEEKEKEKEKETEEFEKDGADVVKSTLSVSLGSSPCVR